MTSERDIVERLRASCNDFAEMRHYELMCQATTSPPPSEQGRGERYDANHPQPSSCRFPQIIVNLVKSFPVRCVRLSLADPPCSAVLRRAASQVQKTGTPGTGALCLKRPLDIRPTAMPDDFSADVNDLDLQAHVEEIVAFFLHVGVSPQQAAHCIMDMVLETFEFYGTRH